MLPAHLTQAQATSDMDLEEMKFENSRNSINLNDEVGYSMPAPNQFEEAFQPQSTGVEDHKKLLNFRTLQNMMSNEGEPQ